MCRRRFRRSSYVSAAPADETVRARDGPEIALGAGFASVGGVCSICRCREDLKLAVGFFATFIRAV